MATLTAALAPSALHHVADVCDLKAPHGAARAPLFRDDPRADTAQPAPNRMRRLSAGLGRFGRRRSPWLAVMLLGSSVNYAAEGVLLALDQPLYLTSVHTFNFAVMTAYTLWLQVRKRRVCRSPQTSVTFLIRSPGCERHP
jgi:hypothetical protein